MRTSNKYLLFFYALTVISFSIPGIIYKYGYNIQQSNNRNVPQYAEAKEIDPRVLARTAKRQDEIKKVRAFLAKYNSPLLDSSETIVDESYIYGLDYRLIVSIAGVESTFCKYPAPGTQYNCWGFKSYSSPSGWWRFTSYKDAIEKVAITISTNRLYSTYQQTGQLYDLAKTYTEVPEEWTWKVKYFIELI